MDDFNIFLKSIIYYLNDLNVKRYNITTIKMKKKKKKKKVINLINLINLISKIVQNVKTNKQTKTVASICKKINKKIIIIKKNKKCILVMFVLKV